VNLRVLRAGLLTTVQDLGRTGHQHEGVPVGGAMDTAALRVANLLVGNAESAAGLEVTLLGPTLELPGDVLLSITGADLAPTLDERPLLMAHAVHAPAGSQLAFGGPRAGCRAYVAFAGGIDVPLVLGSRATYLRAGIGGLHGRALAADDRITLGEPSARSRRIAACVAVGSSASWSPARFAGTALRVLPSTGTAVEVRALRGRHYDELTAASQQALWLEPFVVSGDSDRMGYRLVGPPLALAEPRELVSEAVAFGTVQLPPGGNPIVLLADRQTTGGYPRVLEVASVDLPLLAQTPPGGQVRFREVSLEEAQRLYLAREQELARLDVGITLQLC